MKKKILKTSLILLTLLILASSIKANSPSSIDLSYDYDTKILDVKVFHSVADANTHYIETLDIYVNDILNISPEFKDIALRSFFIAAFAVPMTTSMSVSRSVLEGAQRYDLLNLVKVPLNSLFFLIQSFKNLIVLGSDVYPVPKQPYFLCNFLISSSR